MKKRITLLVLLVLALFFVLNVFEALAGGNARRPAIVAGTARVQELQRMDSGWEGTWYWYVGSTGNATNLTGVTALGLLEAFNDVKDAAYLDAAVQAAAFIQAHLGVGATGTQYHVRTTAPDIVFLHKLSETTGDDSYAIRANQEWANLTSFWPAADDLDAFFRTINRPSIWDIAFFLEAAYLSGDTTWADDAAAILANISDTFYYTDTTWWYALNLAGAVRALVGCGYFEQYSEEVIALLTWLIGMVDEDIGVGGWVQDTAYAVMAFNSVGGSARQYANSLGRWLAGAQEASDGWLEDGDEYPEVDGEAVRALSCTIGSNITIDGFEPGAAGNSSWRRDLNSGNAAPFNGD